MTPEEMKRRTKQFALRAMRLVGSLPKGFVGDVIGRQFLKAATSVGANYRAACRARSTADFIAKLKIVEEEGDESAYWLEIIIEGRLLKPALVRPLLQEAEEILSIIVASILTARSRSSRSKRPAGGKTGPDGVKS